MISYFWLDIILAVVSACLWVGAFGWFWWPDIKRWWENRHQF